MASQHGTGTIGCQEVVEFCMEFLDGTLPADERANFQHHLGCCGQCVTFFETYRKTPEVSRQAVALEMPTEVKDAIRAFLRARYDTPQK